MSRRFTTSTVDPRSLSVESSRIARPNDAQRRAIHGAIRPADYPERGPGTRSPRQQSGLNQITAAFALTVIALNVILFAGQAVRWLAS